jgi:hypothetical protein
LHFCDIYSIFYELLKFNEFLKIENENEIGKRFKWCWANFLPTASWHRPRPLAKGSWLAHARPTCWAHLDAVTAQRPRGQRRGGAPAEGSPAAAAGEGLHCGHQRSDGIVSGKVRVM